MAALNSNVTSNFKPKVVLWLKPYACTMKIGHLYEQELIMDEIPERDVTYHLTCLLIYHGNTTHLYSCFIFF